MKKTPAWASGLAGSRVLFIDPGIEGTGVAFFPLLQYRPPERTFAREGRQYGGTWQRKAHYLAGWVKECIAEARPDNVVIEFPVTFQSAKSHAAIANGSLFKLVFLIGLYDAEVIKTTWGTARLVGADVWKGQLPKNVVDARIKLAWGREYPEHVSDAVGMGLAATGNL